MHFDKFFKFVRSWDAHFYDTHRGGAHRLSEEHTLIKITEELGELAGEIYKNHSRKKREDEWADLVFTIFNHAIHHGYDVERALDRQAKKTTERRAKCVVIQGRVVKQEDVDFGPPGAVGRDPLTEGW